MPAPIFERHGNQVSWTQEPGDRYVVTGVRPPFRGGRRFPAISSDNWNYIAAHNIWQGNFWLLRKGRRHLIKRVTN